MLYYLIVIFFIISDVLLYYQLKKQIGLNREARSRKRAQKKFEKERVKLQKERAKRLAHEAMVKEALDEAFPEEPEKGEKGGEQDDREAY